MISEIWFLTLNPSSPGFSGSKSYNAVAQGPVGFGWLIGVFAGDRIGDGSGDAEIIFLFDQKLNEKYKIWNKLNM